MLEEGMSNSMLSLSQASVKHILQETCLHLYFISPPLGSRTFVLLLGYSSLEESESESE